MGTNERRNSLIPSLSLSSVSLARRNKLGLSFSKLSHSSCHKTNISRIKNSHCKPLFYLWVRTQKHMYMLAEWMNKGMKWMNEWSMKITLAILLYKCICKIAVKFRYWVFSLVLVPSLLIWHFLSTFNKEIMVLSKLLVSHLTAILILIPIKLFLVTASATWLV